jgi:hypothetical protein
MPFEAGAFSIDDLCQRGDGSKRKRVSKLHVSGSYIRTRIWKNVLGHSCGARQIVEEEGGGFGMEITPARDMVHDGAEIECIV